MNELLFYIGNASYNNVYHHHRAMKLGFAKLNRKNWTMGEFLILKLSSSEEVRKLGKNQIFTKMKLLFPLRL